MGRRALHQLFCQFKVPLVSWDYLPNLQTSDSKYTAMTKNVDTTLCNHYITSFCMASSQISRNKYLGNVNNLKMCIYYSICKYLT